MTQAVREYPQACLRVRSARLILNQLKVYQFMPVHYSLRALSHGKALSFVLIAATRRMQWKVNDRAASRFCDQLQQTTIVAFANFLFHC